jgi:hypothetical protein
LGHCRSCHNLPKFNRVLSYFLSDFTCQFNFFYCALQITLNVRENSFETMKQEFVFWYVDILRRNCMLPNVRSIDNAKTVLIQYTFIQGFWVSSFWFFLLRLLRFTWRLLWMLIFNLLLLLNHLSQFLKFHF